MVSCSTPAREAADPPDLGCGAGGGDDAAGRALRYQRARPEHRAPITERGIGRDGVGRLLDRDGLARQDRLLRREAARLDQAQVGRGLVAGLQQDNVAGHEMSAVDRDAPSVAQDGGVGGQHPADRCHGGFRLALPG